MALVKGTRSENTTENVEFHRVKITAAKETLRLLRTRLRLLEASSSEQQHELLPNLTKLELALSLAVHELQKAVAKRQIVELAIERSMLSTLLYIPPKKFFGSTNLNDIEQEVAAQLKVTLSQTQSLQEKKTITDRQLQKITAYRDSLIDITASIVEKLNLQDMPVADLEEKKLHLNNKCKNLNFMRELIAILVTKFGGTNAELFPLLWKWRTPRSYVYYQNLNQ